MILLNLFIHMHFNQLRYDLALLIRYEYLDKIGSN